MHQQISSQKKLSARKDWNISCAWLVLSQNNRKDIHMRRGTQSVSLFFIWLSINRGAGKEGK
ncbi:hypothetical protein ABE67_18360 [Cytobacillus firmus]|nr:hypothetical protein [Cytobacillus firmus]